MAPIIEPTSATWLTTLDKWAEGQALHFIANVEDRNLTIIRRYPGGRTPQESIELTLDQLAEVEAAILNARLWLERANRQYIELRAAEQVAEGLPDQLCPCIHPGTHCTSECHVQPCANASEESA